MALASPFFGKREPEPAPAPYSPNSGRNLNGTVRTETVNNVTPTGLRGDAATTTSSAPSAPAAPNTTSSGTESGSRLIVGPNIKLKGVEITDCDTLVVEGTVEATMDSRVIQIMANGAFKGSADIDIAEIHGKFDGNLTVRDKLVIYAQGKVTGTIRYGKVIIEEGGQLSGDVLFGAKTTLLAGATATTPQKMGVHVA
jgi:cytoskeletal protein CcmA (bactofilin family)